MDGMTRYSQAELQMARTLLLTLRRAGKTTIDELLAAVDAVIRARHGELVDRSTSRPAEAPAEQRVEICPSCGRGIVRRWRMISAQVGADVYGCTTCMWSERR
jgi:predicted RNA-binding Zn-ribbon protein involved in translation (DUF1610 family)